MSDPSKLPAKLRGMATTEPGAVADIVTEVLADHEERLQRLDEALVRFLALPDDERERIRNRVRSEKATDVTPRTAKL